MNTAKNKQQPKRTIFVGGISAATSEQALFEHFSKHATISKVQIMRHKKKSMPKGFAYITLASAEDILRVLQTSHVIDERKLDCQVAANKKEKQTTKDNQMKCTVFVSNLPASLNTDALHEHFEQLGEVRNAYVIFDNDTRESRRVGYVQFVEEEATRAALEAKIVVQGHRLSCVLYKHRFGKKGSSSTPMQSSEENTSIDLHGRDEQDYSNYERVASPRPQPFQAATREAAHASASTKALQRHGYLKVSELINQAQSNYRFNCSWIDAAADGKSDLCRRFGYYGCSPSNSSTQHRRLVPEKSSWSRPLGLSFFSPSASDLQEVNAPNARQLQGSAGTGPIKYSF